MVVVVKVRCCDNCGANAVDGFVAVAAKSRAVVFLRLLFFIVAR